MFYRFGITAPSGTTQDDPKETTLPISFGDITQIMVGFPAGVQGLASIRLLYHEHVMYPEQQDEWVTGEDEQIVLTTKYPVYERAYQLKAQTYNSDDTYDHTLTVRVQVTYPEKLWLAMIYAELQKISAAAQKPKKAPVVIFKKDLLKPEPWRP